MNSHGYVNKKETNNINKKKRKIEEDNANKFTD